MLGRPIWMLQTRVWLMRMLRSFCPHLYCDVRLHSVSVSVSLCLWLLVCIPPSLSHSVCVPPYPTPQLLGQLSQSARKAQQIIAGADDLDEAEMRDGEVCKEEEEEEEEENCEGLEGAEEEEHATQEVIE